MVKAAEKTEAIPAPQQVKTVVSVKATVPLVQYGNIEMFVSQEFYTDAAAPDSDRLERTDEIFNDLKRSLAYIVEDMANAEVERGMPALIKEANPDVWMQKSNSVYRWLRVAQPDMEVPAMQNLLASRQPVLKE